MGEDFLQKRHRQFKRCTDAAFQSILEAENLFSNVPAGSALEVIGFAIDGVPLAVGDELWQAPHQGTSQGESEVLCHGKSLAVELVHEAAAVIRRLGSESKKMVTARVKTISPDGLITLGLHRPYTH